MTQTFSYIKQGIKAEGHSPIYKMHKYFARRPHNVFRYLIESYSKVGDVILDPFLGGGVTLVEGLSAGRRIIGVDINPVATFVSDVQTTPIDLDEYQAAIQVIRDTFVPLINRYYVTTKTEAQEIVPVRWYELAYTVKCDVCTQVFCLSDAHKAIKNGRSVNGKYQCPHCSVVLDAVDADRTGYELLSVTYRINNDSMKRQTKKAEPFDYELMQEMEEQFEQLIGEYDLWFPTDEIPRTWDRQQEDCLYRKSITRFSDFFTKRSLFFTAFLRKLVLEQKTTVSSETYKALLFTFSAVIRFTNSMTISTGGWMDGRPIAWAKHAYWIPNQFVEVNPLEYLDKRVDAIVAGLQYQQRYIANSQSVLAFSELIRGKGTHIVWTQSSYELDLPDESIDAIITDPPYGSNVQYGELTHYWLVWLQDEIPLGEGLFNLEHEILVHRKTHQKDYEDYYEGLYKVFHEGYRVLKHGGVLVFTFNNKDMRAWYAVTRAAVNAGFVLEPEGVIYQEPIENYKNTAHTRYAGSLHGDFIYTFRKLKNEGNRNEKNTEDILLNDVNLEKVVQETVELYMAQRTQATTNELYIVMLQQVIPLLVRMVDMPTLKEDFKNLDAIMQISNFDQMLGKLLDYNQASGIWEKQTV